MRIGRLIFKIYKNSLKLKVYNISIANKYGGSFGYSDTSLWKVIHYWLIRSWFFYLNGATMYEFFIVHKYIIQILKPKYWNIKNKLIRVSKIKGDNYE